MYTHDQVLKKLPDEFSRKDLMSLVVKKGYSISYGDRILEHGILSESIKRVGKGKYQKVKDYED